MLLVFGGFLSPPNQRSQIGRQAKLLTVAGVLLATIVFVITWVFPLAASSRWLGGAGGARATWDGEWPRSTAARQPPHGARSPPPTSSAMQDTASDGRSTPSRCSSRSRSRSRSRRIRRSRPQRNRRQRPRRRRSARRALARDCNNRRSHPQVVPSPGNCSGPAVQGRFLALGVATVSRGQRTTASRPSRATRAADVTPQGALTPSFACRHR